VTMFLVIFVLITYALDFVLWPTHVLSPSLGFLPFSAVFVAIAALVVWPFVSCLVYHSKVISNTGYVLALVRVPPTLDDTVRAFGRLVYRDQKELAQSLARFGALATRHVVQGLRNRNRSVRIGCVLALGELVRQNPQDALANEALVRLPYAQ